jgi:hypothetical protein
MDLEEHAIAGPKSDIRIRTQPDLSRLPLDKLVTLADAVKKYEVSSALALCKVYMRCVMDAPSRPMLT